jgi:hypothetical protein
MERVWKEGSLWKGLTGGWLRRLTEGSALGTKVQVPGNGVWRAARDLGAEDHSEIFGPSLFGAHAFARSFLPVHDDPLLSAPFPCSSAYGRGWE